MSVEYIDLRRIKSTLVIMSGGRNGTYLLSNLLDGQYEILSCPPLTIDKVIENFILRVSNTNRDSITITPDYPIDTIVNKYLCLFKETNHTVLTEDFENELRLTEEFNDGLKRNNHKKGSEITTTSNSEIGVDKEKFCKIVKTLIVLHLEKYNNELSVSNIFHLFIWFCALHGTVKSL